MRFVLAGPMLAVALFVACDEGVGEPECTGDQCLVVNDAGTMPDGALPPPVDGAGIDPLPFDSGSSTLPPLACKGLLELCFGAECCSPYACTNGSCR